MKFSDIEVSLIDNMGTDLSVVNAARVSFHKASEWETYLTGDPDIHNQKLIEGWVDGTEGDDYMYTAVRLKPNDAKLIQYLARNKHFSPFNHTFITCRVKAPVFVARQLVKHKFMPWNEVSRRYVDEEPEFYKPPVWRARADNVKQGSSDQPAPEIERINFLTQGFMHSAAWLYSQLLKMNVSPELARSILPQNMMTEWIWSGTLGAYCDMLRLRLDPHTQAESRMVAEKIYKIVRERYPVSVDALLSDV